MSSTEVTIQNGKIVSSECTKSEYDYLFTDSSNINVNEDDFLSTLKGLEYQTAFAKYL